MTILARILLFYGAYAPLFGLLGVLALKDDPNIPCMAPWVMFGLCGLAILANGLMMHVVHRRAATVITANAPDCRDDDILSYVATYFPIFFGIDFANTPQLIAYALFFLIVGVLQVQADKVYVNPVFLGLGYRIYRVQATFDDNSTKTILLLTRAKQVDRVKLSVKQWGSAPWFIDGSR